MILPVIQRPIDNTALTAYMTCPREYMFGMIQHRRPSGRSPALVFGSAWHTILEHHYKGKSPAEAVKAGLDAWEDHGAIDDYRTIQRLVLVFEQYIKRWGTGQDLKDTLGFPDNPLVESAVQIDDEELAHPYAGKIDRIVLVNGLGYIEDHKTTSRLDRHYFSQFDNSNQMKGYVYMARKLVPSLKIVGARINLAHVTKTKTEFHRHLVTYTPDAMLEWLDNYNNWARRLARDTEANDFPGHFGDNGCKRVYGLCSYHRVCRVSPRLQQKVLESEFDVVPWNPLEAEDATDD